MNLNEAYNALSKVLWDFSITWDKVHMKEGYAWEDFEGAQIFSVFPPSVPCKEVKNPF